MPKGLRDAALAMIDDLRAAWHATNVFRPRSASGTSPPVVRAREIADRCQIEQHEFFRLASNHDDLLRLWASQEAIVTGPFAQLLLLTAGAIENVHLRTKFLRVVAGEHNRLEGDQAPHSHPWLLFVLCESIGINLQAVQPLEPTITFLTELALTLDDLPQALGALGVGNERMLLHEYRAVERCFEKQIPDASYREFLRANIAEDEEHSSLIEEIADSLFDPTEKQRYVEGARAGVSARLKYYDELVAKWHEQGFPQSWKQ